MNVTIDTCSWINLANEYSESDYLQTLETLVNSKNIRLVIPEIVINEWNHHKTDKVYKSKVASFKTKIKHAKSISTSLKTKEKMYHYDDLIKSIERSLTEVENVANESIRRIDDLLAHETTKILTVRNDLKIIASDWAVEKLPPFGSKNSMKDALIFLLTTDFLKDKKDEQNYFISENFSDFATRSEKNSFSGQLKEFSESVNLIYFQNIPLFMKEVEGIDVEITEGSESAGILFEREELIKRLKNTGICHVCGGEVKQVWLRSFKFPELSLHINCANCGYDIDTLEFWD